MHPITVDLRPSDTHDLRAHVLRQGTLSADVDFDGDTDHDTFHLGLEVDGELVAISSWMRRSYPDLPAADAYQLRGMATDPAFAGRGLGAQLLAAGLERCLTVGADVVWACGRDAALDFYRRHGFESVGLGYTDLTTGLPHHDVIRRLFPVPVSVSR